MFDRDKERIKRAQRAGRVDTLIGEKVVIRGDISFSGGLYLEGRVHGSISAQDPGAVLTLADNGYVEGEVRAPVVVINGELRGDVHSSERVELAGNARVLGNIHYKVVEMAAGAAISGRLLHAETPVVASVPEPEYAPERPILLNTAAA
ncbi:polymer-forming cytoskeletal protein [Luteimonas sp. SX5]|uniref:Polymer-forming cytoskeletal protein n=1 Tax=Luteimonas galliterrae TaxID=2940486 RepID=A0ABT0MLW6_9GAMM|nr:polymer-forming cytoskeletal protein [Luteimonas galliterrae]MCL1635578.1 polymer-forming cytoskeletal protein [Luteimonas galliterrae]